MECRNEFQEYLLTHQCIPNLQQLKIQIYETHAHNQSFLSNQVLNHDVLLPHDRHVHPHLSVHHALLQNA